MVERNKFIGGEKVPEARPEIEYELDLDAENILINEAVEADSVYSVSMVSDMVSDPQPITVYNNDGTVVGRIDRDQTIETTAPLPENVTIPGPNVDGWGNVVNRYLLGVNDDIRVAYLRHMVNMLSAEDETWLRGHLNQRVADEVISPPAAPRPNRFTGIQVNEPDPETVRADRANNFEWD